MFRTILLRAQPLKAFCKPVTLKKVGRKNTFSTFKHQLRPLPREASILKFLKYGTISGLGLISTSRYVLANGNSNNPILPGSLRDYQLSDAAGAITVGAVSGFFTGFVVKKIGTLSLFVVGTLGIVFQLAASGGYIEIKWDKIERKANEIIDEAQKEVDGIDMNKPEAIINKKLAPMVLGHKAPTGGGFAAGFFLGLRF